MLFARPRLVRAARYAAYAAIALVALAVAAAFVLPAFLDTQRVETELQAKLSEAVHGEVAWEKLEIRLLPSPRGALSNVRAEIPGTASLRAAEVEAHLRLLPLLRGRAEIASVSLSNPVIALEIAPPPSGKKKPREEAPADPVGAYRSAIEAVRRFAPESVLEIENADLDVRVAGLPPIRLRKLEVLAKTGSAGLNVEATAESEYWERMKLAASVSFAELSGEARLEAAAIKPQVWLDHYLADSPVRVALPATNLRARARTDGREKLECDFDLGAASVEIVRAAERLQIPNVALAGKVSADRREIAVTMKDVRFGSSRLGAGSLRYPFKNGALSALAEFDLDLAQAMDGTRRLLAEEAGEALAAIQPVTGRAQGQVKFEMPRSGWKVLVDIRKSDSSIAMEGVPGPVMLAGASVTVTRDTVRIERADVSMLDARALASVTIGHGKRLRIEGAVSEGSVGDNFLAWAWKTAGVPPQLALKTPIRVAVQRAAWSPKQPLDLAATAAFDAGPSVGAELAWTPKSLDIRRATIKDSRSDAALALHVEKGLLEGRFSGSLQSTSIGAALKSASVPSGGGSGDLRFRVDLKHPERFSAAGELKGESIDLSWLLDRPVTIERVDLDADGAKLNIRQASVNWAGQRFVLSGDLTRAPDGAPVIDAQLESPGVVVDALLPKPGAKQAVATEEKTKPRAADEALWTLWPLPVRGRIALRSEFIQYGERKAAPVVAALVLEEQKASLELQQVRLCGVSLPLTVEGTPRGLAIAAHIAAQKQQLEQTARCLTEQGLLITGEFDLRADLRTRGRLRELLPNLEGTVSAESRNGRVMKFALLGNILSMKGVADMLKEGESKVDSKGFPYRSFSAKGRFTGGRFIIDESAFNSSAVGLAATGWISLKDYESKLSVLVAPFARVDRLARSVPIIGYITGGVLTSIPVGVSGDIRDPRVVPLGPSAVTSELVGIFERAIKLPGKLVPSEGAPAEPRPTP
jgi:AsmA-like protein